ncbi:Dipeptidyl aminopeptidase/acylaminoacyl-peptidase-like protein [Sphingomonas paucimobilis]|nr:Dipeptidyl aminopeptidase/acylaminoacyl-peptidase-like protein [Sphingomonas paucimobilis]
MFEPFPGNYVWNLSVNLALSMGAQIGEIDIANDLVREAARDGADAGTLEFLRAWGGLADRLVEQAREDVCLGRRFSASDKYKRACLYYMTAERMQRHGQEGREEAYAKMLDAMEQSIRLGERAVERVEIPFEGTSYPGLFVAAEKAAGPAPCMIHTNGLDSIKEMLYWTGIAQQFARRGISTLMIDHPGVGEALRLRGLAGMYDSERWAGAAVDYLETRADVDADAIGIIGWSLGGYYAPRAAAFEDRLKLCVSWGANHYWGKLQEARLRNEGENPVPHYWGHVMWVFGQPDMDSFMAFAPKMDLDGVVEKIRVPYLITHGENDRQIPIDAAYRSYEQATASPKRELKIFTRETGGIEHVSADNQAPAQEFITDWVAETFAQLRQAGGRAA